MDLSRFDEAQRRIRTHQTQKPKYARSSFFRPIPEDLEQYKRNRHKASQIIVYDKNGHLLSDTSSAHNMFHTPETAQNLPLIRAKTSSLGYDEGQYYRYDKRDEDHLDIYDIRGRLLTTVGFIQDFEF